MSLDPIKRLLTPPPKYKLSQRRRRRRQRKRERKTPAVCTQKALLERSHMYARVYFENGKL
jgi:hypothetical protein